MNALHADKQRPLTNLAGIMLYILDFQILIANNLSPGCQGSQLAQCLCHKSFTSI